MCALIYQDACDREQAEETEGKESTAHNLEMASDEQESTARIGRWKRIRQRLQRNTQNIKLVSDAAGSKH